MMFAVSVTHKRYLACKIRDLQGENCGHENVRERCTVRLLVYFLFCASTINPRFWVSDI
jgi:hypothetical protein